MVRFPMDDPVHRILNKGSGRVESPAGASQLVVVCAVGRSYEGMVSGPGAGPGGPPEKAEGVEKKDEHGEVPSRRVLPYLT